MWIFEGNLDARAVISNTFQLEWPRGSGKIKECPEIDRASWFTLEVAKQKIIGSQIGFLNELEHRLTEITFGKENKIIMDVKAENKADTSLKAISERKNISKQSTLGDFSRRKK